MDPYSKACLLNCHWLNKSQHANQPLPPPGKDHQPTHTSPTGSFFNIWHFPLHFKSFASVFPNVGRSTLATKREQHTCGNILWLQRAFSVAPFKWPCSYLHKLATVCLLFQQNQLVRGLHCFCLVRGGGRVDCVKTLFQQLHCVWHQIHLDAFAKCPSWWCGGAFSDGIFTISTQIIWQQIKNHIMKRQQKAQKQ